MINSTLMPQYRLEEVTDKHQIKEFHNLPKRLYKGNRHWVCPLDGDIESRFDPSRNALLSGGQAIRWIARDAKGQVVGRIAAFFNNEQVGAYDELPTGGCGFFEAINDQELANLLFDASRDWLAARGMQSMVGPVNFGDRDQWWGLLVEGYELQPLYANNYNPAYYKELFENYGFQNYFNQFSYYRDMKQGVFNPAVYDRVKRLTETPGYRFEHIKKGNLTQVADDFRRIYNKAWALFTGVKPIDREHAQKLMRTMKPIIDERLIYFAYFNDEPIGFFIMVPDINRVIGKFGGKLNLINKLRLVCDLRRGKADRIFAIIFAVDPDFHGKGIESGIMHSFEKTLARGVKLPYKTLELAWIGDFNPVMMRMCENYVCASRHKMHTTYRYHFDRSIEFKRCPRMGIKRNTATAN